MNSCENWTITVGTPAFSADENTGKVVMETSLGTVVIVWDKNPHDRWMFDEKELKRLKVRVGSAK